MAKLKYLSQYILTKLNVAGGITNTQTTGIILLSTSGIDKTKPGQICLSYSDPLNIGLAEWIDYDSINDSNELVGAVRGREGYSARTHLNQATVAFVISKSHINDIVDLLNGSANGIVAKGGISLNQEIASTPSSGFTSIYAKSDGKIYKKTSDGVEAEIGTGGGGNADTVDGFHASTTPAAGQIPVLDSEMAMIKGGSMSRQAITNGNFDIAQKATTLNLILGVGAFAMDRWLDYHATDGSLPTLTRSQQKITPGDISGAYFFSRLATNGSGTISGTGSIGLYRQRIEFGTRYLCGANKKVTVSFWARSSITNKKLGVYLNQCYGSGGSPTGIELISGSYFILSSGWTKYTYTFTTNTLIGKTFGTNNDDYLELIFVYMWGTDVMSYVGAGGAETYVGSGNIDIAQVQLCAGDVALPFQPKSYEDELRACMRYYEKRLVGNNGVVAIGSAYSTTAARVFFQNTVPMRVAPTAIEYASLYLGDGANTVLNAVPALAIMSPTTSYLEVTVASGLTQFRPYILYGASAAGYIALSAEL